MKESSNRNDLIKVGYYSARNIISADKAAPSLPLIHRLSRSPFPAGEGL